MLINLRTLRIQVYTIIKPLIGASLEEHNGNNSVIMFSENMLNNAFFEENNKE